MKFRVWWMAAILSLCGCSAFNYEWRHASGVSTPSEGITGRWEGRWQSEVNGHEDAMRCIITQVGTNLYDAKFHAAYRKWITFHFGYTVRLEARPSEDGLSFRGSEDLGVLAGGVYTYEGFANASSFHSTYRCKYDHGTFRMKRPVN